MRSRRSHLTTLLAGTGLVLLVCSISFLAPFVVATGNKVNKPRAETYSHNDAISVAAQRRQQQQQHQQHQHHHQQNRRRNLEHERQLQVIDGAPIRRHNIVIWRRGGSQDPRFAYWDEDGAVFNPSADGIVMGGDSVGEWRIIRGAQSPSSSSDSETIVMGVSASSGNIGGKVLTHSNAMTWEDIQVPTSTGNTKILATVTETDYWSFDVKYESQSGRSMMVWANGDSGFSSVSYSVGTGQNTWTTVGDITLPNEGVVRQLQMASCPTRDEMVLVVSNNNTLTGVESKMAIVWDGTSWGSSKVLHDVGPTDDHTDVNVAYSSFLGKAVIVFGANSVNLQYTTWTGSAWGGVGGMVNKLAVTGNVRWTMVASDPSSNHILCGVLTDNSEVWTLSWTGYRWTNMKLHTRNAPGSTFPAIDVAYEAKSGKGLVAFGVSGQASISYSTLDASGGIESTSVGPALSDVPNSIRLYPDPTSNQVFAFAQTSVQSLEYSIWNGNAASCTVATSVETATGETKNQPFLFMWDADPASEDSYHPSTSPSHSPTKRPSRTPSSSPQASPSSTPSLGPSQTPSNAPSATPSSPPTTSLPPSDVPSDLPSISSSPTVEHSSAPSVSLRPTSVPSSAPSVSHEPSDAPSGRPSMSLSPTVEHSNVPSVSLSPTGAPSLVPSMSHEPSDVPSGRPSLSTNPTVEHSFAPSVSLSPTVEHSSVPSVSLSPTSDPSLAPSRSHEPSDAPSGRPSLSMSPTVEHSSAPSGSVAPSGHPNMDSVGPSLEPSRASSGPPSSFPRAAPSMDASSKPSVQISMSPSATFSSTPSTSVSNGPSAVTAKPSSSFGPSATDSERPTQTESAAPSDPKVSNMPSSSPTTEHSSSPSLQGSSPPSLDIKTLPPTNQGSEGPNATLSRPPSSSPTADESSSSPSVQHSEAPSLSSSASPSSAPATAMPNAIPTVIDSQTPSSKPSSYPSSKSAAPSEVPSLGADVSESPSAQPSRPVLVRTATFSTIDADQKFVSSGYSSPTQTYSSIYFVATDPTVGATDMVWWTQSGFRSNGPVSIRLVASCPGGNNNPSGEAIMVAFKAGQRTCSDLWQFNAVRFENTCPHVFVLDLDRSIGANAWLGRSDLHGCVLESESEVDFIARAYSQNESGSESQDELVGTIRMVVRVNVEGVPTAMPSAAPSEEEEEEEETVVSGAGSDLDTTESPTIGLTLTPSLGPTNLPSVIPTESPTASPSSGPTPVPTSLPTRQPSKPPSPSPVTNTPTSPPSQGPTSSPNNRPTSRPTDTPSALPTLRPATPDPTALPSAWPSKTTAEPSEAPTTQELPTKMPSFVPTSLSTGSLSTSDPSQIPTKLSSSPSPSEAPADTAIGSSSSAPSSNPSFFSSAPTIPVHVVEDESIPQQNIATSVAEGTPTPSISTTDVVEASEKPSPVPSLSSDFEQPSPAQERTNPTTTPTATPSTGGNSTSSPYDDIDLNDISIAGASDGDSATNAALATSSPTAQPTAGTNREAGNGAMPTSASEAATASPVTSFEVEETEVVPESGGVAVKGDSIGSGNDAVILHITDLSFSASVSYPISVPIDQMLNDIQKAIEDSLSQLLYENEGTTVTNYHVTIDRVQVTQKVDSTCISSLPTDGSCAIVDIVVSASFDEGSSKGEVQFIMSEHLELTVGSLHSDYAIDDFGPRVAMADAEFMIIGVGQLPTGEEILVFEETVEAFLNQELGSDLAQPITDVTVEVVDTTIIDDGSRRLQYRPGAATREKKNDLVIQVDTVVSGRYRGPRIDDFQRKVNDAVDGYSYQIDEELKKRNRYYERATVVQASEGTNPESSTPPAASPTSGPALQDASPSPTARDQDAVQDARGRKLAGIISVIISIALFAIVGALYMRKRHRKITGSDPTGEIGDTSEVAECVPWSPDQDAEAYEENSIGSLAKAMWNSFNQPSTSTSTPSLEKPVGTDDASAADSYTSGASRATAQSRRSDVTSSIAKTVTFKPQPDLSSEKVPGAFSAKPRVERVNSWKEAFSKRTMWRKEGGELQDDDWGSCGNTSVPGTDDDGDASRRSEAENTRTTNTGQKSVSFAWSIVNAIFSSEHSMGDTLAATSYGDGQQRHCRFDHDDDEDGKNGEDDNASGYTSDR